MDWEALLLTLKLDVVVCGLLLVIGSNRLLAGVFPLALEVLLEAVVALPLSCRNVLGFYMLLAMGPKSPLGRMYGWIWGHGLPFTFAGS